MKNHDRRQREKNIHHKLAPRDMVPHFRPFSKKPCSVPGGRNPIESEMKSNSDSRNDIALIVD